MHSDTPRSAVPFAPLLALLLALVLLVAGVATPAAPAAAAVDDPSPSASEATATDTPDADPVSTEADSVSTDSVSTDPVSTDPLGGASSTGASLGSEAGDGPSIGLLSISQCPSSNLCLWTAAPYAGSMAATNSTAVYNTGIATARSVRNRANTAARLFSGLNGTGTSRCYAAGASVSSTSVTARSFRILGTTEC